MRVRDNIEMDKLEDNMVMCDTISGETYMLNMTASFVAERLHEDTSYIIREYIQYFGVSQEVADKDVRDVFDQLVQYNLVE